VAIKINEALDSIGTLFGFRADDLIDYAARDPHGGYHAKHDDGFPIGSIWRVEGQILYALARAVLDNMPDGETFQALELGTFRGCSATHIAQAINDSGKSGRLTCVDLTGGDAILTPAHLLRYIDLMRGDMFDFLQQADETGRTFDFLFEDGSHSAADVERVWKAAYHLINPGGVIVSHDAEHFIVGKDVKQGMASAGYFNLPSPARTYLIEPSDCGLGVFRAPTIVPTKQAKMKTAPALEDMTIAELRQYADDNGIVLGTARVKANIIQVIQEAERVE
jgi:predicted O-methyltransferase YrrM